MDNKDKKQLDTDQNDQTTTADDQDVKEEKSKPEEISVDETNNDSSDEIAEEEASEDKPVDNIDDDFDEDTDKENIIIINKNVDEKANWYVVHTYSGHENKVALSLKERVEASGHSDKVFKIFLPHQQKIVVSEGKKRSVDEKLFPGYLIVLMIMNDDSWYVVRSTPGVTGFVGMGSTPTPLPDSEVQTLMKFAKMEAPKFEAKFRVGDSIKVNDGPFKDFLGKVDEVNDEQGKVKVLISVFGRETPLELDFAQISQL